MWVLQQTMTEVADRDLIGIAVSGIAWNWSEKCRESK